MIFREPRNETERRISRSATDWLSKIDLGLDGSQQDKFLEWLGSDPRHGEWFAMHRQAWQNFDLLKHWKPEHSQLPNPDLLAKQSPLRRWRKLGALTALAACLIGGINFLALERPTQISKPSFETNEIIATQYTHQLLSDGSEIDLNAGSSLVVTFDRTERFVELLTGEAYFKVTKDPSRPFIVKAGRSSMRAVGTEFNVRHSLYNTELLVTEGVVSLQTFEINQTAGSSASHGNPEQKLSVGQRLTLKFEDNGPHSQLETLDPVEVELQLRWKPVQLDFNATTLAVAIAQFNHRNDRQLVLEYSDMADFPITGSFRSNNIEGFARLLELTSDIEVEDQPAGPLILRKRQHR